MKSGGWGGPPIGVAFDPLGHEALCVCVCVCERERKRERECECVTEKERESERETSNQGFGADLQSEWRLTHLATRLATCITEPPPLHEMCFNSKYFWSSLHDFSILLGCAVNFIARTISN